MSDFEESSFHNNMGRRMMTPKEEEEYPWNELKRSDIDVCKTFLKLCIVEDPIWDKISCKLEEPSHDIHVDECVKCEIHASINNDFKVLTTVVEDIARVFLQDNNEE
ncbi:hypothetical protein Tco_1164177 [Tanacetum coccineum]